MNETVLKAKMDELGKAIHEMEEKQMAFDMETQDLQHRIAELKDELKPVFLEMKTGKKSQCLEVRYRKGAVKWKTNWLEGFAAGHPEYGLEKYRSVSEPTIAFLARDEGWEDDGR